MKEVSIIQFSPTELRNWYPAEVWLCNTHYKLAAQYFHKLFIMHKQVVVKGKSVFDWEEIEEQSKKRGFEIVTLHSLPLKSTPYPYQEIVGYFKTDYFSCTAAYQIAFALYKNYQKIRLFDVDFFNGVSETTDDLNERCGVEFWLGIAHNMGVKIEIHGSSLLTTTTGKPYAWEG